MKFIKSFRCYFLWNDYEKLKCNKELLLLQILFSPSAQKVRANADNKTLISKGQSMK